MGIEGTKLGIPVITLLSSFAPVFAFLLPMYYHHHHQLLYLSTQNKTRNLKSLHKTKATRNSQITDVASRAKPNYHFITSYSVQIDKSNSFAKKIQAKTKTQTQTQIQIRTYRKNKPSKPQIHQYNIVVRRPTN